MKYKLPLLLGLVVIMSGCSVIKINSSKSNQDIAAGVYKTANRGDVWTRKDDMFTVRGQARKIVYTNPTFIKQDSKDANSLFLGTNAGLYYSFDRGEGWFLALAGQGTINDMVIDGTDSCTMFAAVHNRIFKSTNCARTWEPIHYTSVAGEYFTSITQNLSDANVLYVGTSRGTLLTSRNAGVSWEVIQYINRDVIQRFVMNPKNSHVFYMVTQKGGILRTADDGLTWEPLNKMSVNGADGQPKINPKNKKQYTLEQLAGTNVLYDLKFDPSQEEGLIYASQYGIFRFINGSYWQEIEILSKPREQLIQSVALDGTSGQEMYFATPGFFYRSVNGGAEWTVKKLPTTANPKFLVLMPDKPGELVLAFYVPPKK